MYKDCLDATQATSIGCMTLLKAVDRLEMVTFCSVESVQCHGGAEILKVL